ncbi:3-deoxy-D-manno-octulosonic acid transferase [Candidatus Pelagibacter sp.]|nr:3-deoxy-D-manno-octulosonic acid transferase [Candidatus Pelagibacter sp.]
MLLFYRIIINLLILVSPIIIIIRLIKRKESFSRFKEKFCFFSKPKIKGKLIWFHGASVGELQSIVPLIEKLEKKKDIKQILVTSNTLSSSKIMEKISSKKIIHQFFPVDANILSRKFLNYWKPNLVFFVDSEVWPNMIKNLHEKKIPFGLINGRITKKTFKRWMKIPNFSKNVFSKFNLCLSSNNQSKIYLKKLGAREIKFLGNLKFSQSENEKVKFDTELKKFIRSKKVWCASSTHKTEEEFCGLVHKELKKKYSNLLTIIIPRHIERVEKIEKELKGLNLKVHLHEPKTKIRNDTDVYIVNAYGKTKSFYNNCKNIFLGGSLIKHGGQNPLEATRYGCNILHGPNIENFKEIYDFLRIKKMTKKINNQKDMIYSLNRYFSKNSNTNKIQKKLNLIGQNILYKTYNEINFLIKNET